MLILGMTQGSDINTIFQIAKVRRTGDRITFIVPVTGKVDDDAISFTLHIEGNRLRGSGRELREGAQSISVTFEKQGSRSELASLFGIPGSREEIGRVLARLEKMTKEMKKRAQSGNIKADIAQAEVKRFLNEYQALLGKAIAGVEKVCNHDEKRSEALLMELMKQYAPDIYNEMERTRREALKAKEEHDRKMREIDQMLKESQSKQSSEKP
jgi:hypothetical protein